MTTMTRYCEFIIEEGEHEGQKCGVAYRTQYTPSKQNVKYCPEHDSCLLKSGLIRSKNVHTVVANQQAMLNWVKERMSIQPGRDKTLIKIQRDIRNLRQTIADKIDDIETSVALSADDDVISILTSLGILDEQSNLQFATQRNLITVQNQLRETNARLEHLESLQNLEEK
jgi:hypothetical protein|tara:strand:+ start:3718 stop:4227 length:510 start_codon:yes stop_codon:yes gene_type:complete